MDYFFNNLVGGALNSAFGGNRYGTAPAGPISHLSNRLTNRFQSSPGVQRLGNLFPRSAHNNYSTNHYGQNNRSHYNNFGNYGNNFGHRGGYNNGFGGGHNNHFSGYNSNFGGYWG